MSSPATMTQRCAMSVDQIESTGKTPNIDVVTHYPSDHFFERLFVALR